MQHSRFCAALLLVLTACSSLPQVRSPITYSSRLPASERAQTIKTSFVSDLPDEATFHAVATKPGGVLRTGEIIKFLIDNRGYPNNQPTLYFINGNYCDKTGCPADWVALHRTWAEHNLKNFHYDNASYSAAAFHTNDLTKKSFVEGRIQTFEWQGQVIYGVWFVEMDQIAEESIQFALEHIKAHFSIPNQPLHLITFSTQQTIVRIKDWLSANQIEPHTIGELIADLKVQSLNVGEAWGFLRLFPRDPDELEATDIPVFDVLPLDLAVVAGTITTAYQDVGSHINLKSKERNTPNLIIRDPKLIDQLRVFDGQPVHLQVNADGYTVEPSTGQVVQAKLEAKLNHPWMVSDNDLTGEILHFDEMCRHKDPSICLGYAPRFGGKASRLGFLAHRKVAGAGSDIRKQFNYRLSPLGFGVPIRYYKEFLEHNIKLNPELKALRELIDSEKGTQGAMILNSTEKKAKIAVIQQALLNGKFPPGMYAKLEAQVAKMKVDVAAAYPGEVLNKLKIRSSANVEDITGFNGAGLHDSFSAKIKKSIATEADGPCHTVSGSAEDDMESRLEIEPESLACAIKGTYASLWNLRAVRERTYRRFDHESSLMGLVIMPSHKFRSVPSKLKIVANSVLVTRVLNTSTTYGYQVSTQVGENLVTNPIPGTLAELATMTFQLKTEPQMTVLRYAQPEKNGPVLTAPILSPKKMREIVAIGRAIEEAYCTYKKDYAPGFKCTAVSNSQRKPKSLDMEIKIFENGELSFKQMREFSGH